MTFPAAPSFAGFYETFRTSGGRPHHWRYHLARLKRACAAFGRSFPSDGIAADEARLANAVTEQLRAQALADAVFRYSIRFATASSATAEEELAMRPLPSAPPAAGVALRVLRTAREKSPFELRPKVLRDPTIAAATAELESRATAPSDEGLLLAADGGEVVETTRQCVFWITAGQVFHPAPELGGVAGTGWGWLVESGLVSQAAAASLDELVCADAVAVCNSVRGVTPVAELWDVADRALLRRYESASHPRIGQLSAAWRDALDRTAAGGGA